jgi:hypothetical protein
MDLAPDFDEFIGSLLAHGAEFVIVGAYALAFHGAPRYTGDIDVLVRPTLDNCGRVLAAIAAFGFPTAGLTAADIADTRRMLAGAAVAYSVRSATTGSRRAARRAGNTQAPMPAATSRRAAVAYASGSSVLTP